MAKYTLFEEVPQFITSGSYTVDQPLEYLPKWLEDMTKELGLEMNPDFQRGHVWTEDQQCKYIEFLLRGGKSGRDIYFNYPSWRINVKDGEYNDFVCVDGLQRITAIMRFLNNEIRVFGSFYKEYTDKLDSIRHSVRIHINDLKTRKEVLQWYLEMNSGGIPHAKAELERVRKLLEKS